jgi:aspartate aminotransferase
MIKHSATLAVNEKIAIRRAQGKRVLHLGFGEAGLPVLPSIAEALHGAVSRNSYGSVVGSQQARLAAAGYFERRGLPTDPERVVFAPGSKALLYGVLASLRGDLVLPVPSWVTYAAQAALTGKRVISVPVPKSAGGVPDPERLESALHEARQEGANPRILILTLPDNPTGTAAGADLVKRVCDIADRHELVVLSDEIYRDLTYDEGDHLSPATLLPDRAVVTSGLSKNMALGGWRIGFTRLPHGELGEEIKDHLVGVASEVWSSMATPMQEAAAYVLNEPDEVASHLAASRRLHASVSRAVHEVFVEAGAACRKPNAAFYMYPDLSNLRPSLPTQRVATGEQFAELLLERHGVAVLAGEHFGDDPLAFRFRVATSLLYGTTDEQRWEALQCDDPVSLPWIADALNHLRSALAELG